MDHRKSLTIVGNRLVPYEDAEQENEKIKRQDTGNEFGHGDVEVGF